MSKLRDGVVMLGVVLLLSAASPQTPPDAQVVVQLSGESVAALSLALADFSEVVNRQHSEGSVRTLRNCHATVKSSSTGVEIEFVGGAEEVGGGSTYWVKSPFTKIDRRVLHK
ncbi:MAG: hypothetical protein ACOZQL_34870 [Myxococcota bacterium]